MDGQKEACLKMKEASSNGERKENHSLVLRAVSSLAVVVESEERLT